MSMHMLNTVLNECCWPRTGEKEKRGDHPDFMASSLLNLRVWPYLHLAVKR